MPTYKVTIEHTVTRTGTTTINAPNPDAALSKAGTIPFESIPWGEKQSTVRPLRAEPVGDAESDPLPPSSDDLPA